jgi:hypothetical protein
MSSSIPQLFEPSRKQAALLRYIEKAGEVHGVYELAQSLGRPYKRVLEHVRVLAAVGLLDLEKQIANGRVVTLIRARNRRKQPVLSYSRVWSSPVSGVDDTVLIASVLAEPTFDDVLACCRHYGVSRVRQVFNAMLRTGEMPSIVQKSVGRMLTNIEIGFARAA